MADWTPPEVSSSPKSSWQPPETIKKEKPFGQKALEFAEPTVEFLGTAGGAALGTPLGPLGTVGGAGLGYGASREIMRLAKEKMGYAQPQALPERAKENIKDILAGASFEAGGRGIVAPAFEKTAKGIARGYGKVSDYLSGKLPTLRATGIAKEALGENLPEARRILSTAADDLTASQALSAIDPATGKPLLNAPVAQALLLKAQQRDANFFAKLFGKQEEARFRELAKIAGGADQTAARAARDEMKKTLNDRLIPILNTELEAANIAGKLGPKFEQQAGRMAGAAAEKVQDVRRFVAAGGRAEDMARQQMIERGLPVGAAKYTYPAELAKRADDVANQAAEGSLRFGEAAQFANAAKDSLEAYGLRPLESAPIIQSISAKLRDPKLAGNRDISASLNQVARDIQSWTKNGGVIDAFALDSIRKNSVNAAIQRLYPGASRESQKELAAKVVDSVKPILIDAVENAGGTGYRAYLESYAKGAQEISQTKLGAQLLELYEKNPKEFVRFVEGNSPAEVEKVFGAGNYDIAKQMSDDAMNSLRGVAREVKGGIAAKEQAEMGMAQATSAAQQERKGFKLPAFINRFFTVTNKVLDVLEGQVSDKTMKALSEASKSGKSLDKLLGELPAVERNSLLAVLNNPKNYEPLKNLAGASLAAKSERKLNPIPKSKLSRITGIQRPL